MTDPKQEPQDPMRQSPSEQALHKKEPQKNDKTNFSEEEKEEVTNQQATDDAAKLGEGDKS